MPTETQTLDDFVEPETFLSIVRVVGREMGFLTTKLMEKEITDVPSFNGGTKYLWKININPRYHHGIDSYYFGSGEFKIGPNHEIDFINSVNFKKDVGGVTLNLSRLINSANRRLVLVSRRLQLLDYDEKLTELYINDELAKKTYEKIQKIARFMRIDNRLPSDASCIKTHISYYERPIGKLSPEPCKKCGSNDVYENEDRYEGNEDDYIDAWRVCVNCLDADFHESIWTPGWTNQKLNESDK